MYDNWEQPPPPHRIHCMRPSGNALVFFFTPMDDHHPSGTVSTTATTHTREGIQRTSNDRRRLRRSCSDRNMEQVIFHVTNDIGGSGKIVLIYG